MKKLLVVAFMLAGLFIGRAEAVGSIAIIETSPTYNSWIHFNYVYPQGLKDCKNAIWWNCAYTRINCYQGTTHVWFNARPAYDSSGAGSNGFFLGSPSSDPTWQNLGGGAATCIAVLFEFSHSNPPVITDHASLAFNVGA